MRNAFLLPVILLSFSCTVSKNSQQNKTKTAIYQPYIDSIIKEFAPDKRVALVTFTSESSVLKGETNVPEAKTSLLYRLKSAGIPYIDSIRVLPDESVRGKIFAVSSNSVSNLRSQPRHSAELSTQVVLGTPLKVYKKFQGWYLVQSPDLYLGWVDEGGIRLMDSVGFNQWKSSEKIIFTDPAGYATELNENMPVSDLVYGAVVELINKSDTSYEIRFPDGRNARINHGQGMLLKEWINSRNPLGDNLVKSSRQLMGLPYLWGGTSFKGVDCSGFTKIVYFMNGLVIPRDASQQVTIGLQVDTTGNWSQLQKGDLLFFGVPARDGKPERVVHVGMWIGGNHQFIHSSGRVRISSMNPGSPDYDADEHKRFLRVKRISAEAALIDLKKEALFSNEL